jgi:hypothetical protein
MSKKEVRRFKPRRPHVKAAKRKYRRIKPMVICPGDIYWPT